jgi:Zn-dependent protease
MLAVGADVGSPLFWAVFIGWVLSVVLHEFAHGLVAHLGGDYTIRERGGLTLNPLQYVDPVMSIILPVVFLWMGGVPLPGGVTYVRRDLLRSRAWMSAVSAAGPAMNFLLFLALAVALHPHAGWVDPTANVTEWTAGQKLVGAMAFLELFSVLLNLIPIPPLDGFGIISPYLPPRIQEQATRGPAAFGLFFFLFLLLFVAPGPTMQAAYTLMGPVADLVGVSLTDLKSAANLSLYNQP